MSETQAKYNSGSANPSGTKPSLRFSQRYDKVAKFGKELVISPKAAANHNHPGYRVKVYDESVTVTIGIGKDHIAELVMTKQAYEAFISGEKVTFNSPKDLIS